MLFFIIELDEEQIKKDGIINLDLAESFKSVQVTNIGRTYDITNIAIGRLSNDDIKSNSVEKQKTLQIEYENNSTLNIDT